MKKFKFTIRGNEYDVDIKEFDGDLAKIEVNGTEYEVEVHQEQVKVTKTPTLVRSRVDVDRKESKIKKTIGSTYSLKAPLPGSIFKILMTEGDVVEKGDTIMIMEAMKMENNIQSEKSGKIVSVKVKEGDSVLQGDLLIEIE